MAPVAPSLAAWLRVAATSDLRQDRCDVRYGAARPHKNNNNGVTRGKKLEMVELQPARRYVGAGAQFIGVRITVVGVGVDSCQYCAGAAVPGVGGR